VATFMNIITIIMSRITILSLYNNEEER